MSTLGTVAAIDRTNRVVGAYLDGTNLLVTAPYTGSPPPPLTRCDFTQAGRGRWVCQQPRADVRQLLQDDFTAVLSSSGYGDTFWRQVGTLGTIAQATAPVDAGAALMTTTTTAYQRLGLSKDNHSVIPSTSGIWMSAEVVLSSTSHICVYAGLMSDGVVPFSQLGASDAGAWLVFDSAADAAWTGEVWDGSQPNFAHTGGHVDTTVTFDIVYVSTTFAAFWVNGDGPFWAERHVPGASNGLQPAFHVAPRTAVASTLQVEFCRVALVNPVRSPRSLAGAAPAGQPFILNDPVRGKLNSSRLG